jgi:hypothetical protein
MSCKKGNFDISDQFENLLAKAEFCHNMSTIVATCGECFSLKAILFSYHNFQCWVVISFPKEEPMGKCRVTL